jgi:cold shock CspA family protein
MRDIYFPFPAGHTLGRVKWFNVAKGWGFLTPIDTESGELQQDQEVFVHQVRK